jgi:hypothetical protein
VLELRREAMKKTLDKGQFWDLFKNRAVVVTDLPPGQGRDLAERVNEAEGRGDASLRTGAEYSALFDLLLRDPGSASTPAGLMLLDQHGHVTAAGQAVELYLKASTGKDELFDQAMYMIHVTGWPQPDRLLEEPVEASGGARLALWGTDPGDRRHLSPPDQEGVLFATSSFSLMNSGNRTLRAPKRSWKINFEVEGGDDRLVGTSRLNLKAMFNDPSQMREALAWDLFGKVGVPSSRHTYAKLGINERYMGLFSVIEQVDRRFLRGHFGKNDKGNLFKAYCGDIGCATLEHRVGDNGDDSGGQYRPAESSTHPTYRLKTNEDDQIANTYDDLAHFIRVINGIGLPGGDGRFDSDAFRESVESIMNATGFLRWAGVNLLIGSWDNYFATPANYYLYNSGQKGGEREFVESPYFTFIPWDYDHSFGIDFFDTRWQYTDIVDWPSNTRNYWSKNALGLVSRIPLVQNLLRNRDFLRYYLDHLEYLLDTDFNPDVISAKIGIDDGDGLWGRVCQAAYLESDTPYGRPFTGRQFTNDEVYLTGYQQHELRRGEAKIEGIFHYVLMRYDRAREQLATLRRAHPRGASGATFSDMMETLPERV